MVVVVSHVRLIGSHPNPNELHPCSANPLELDRERHRVLCNSFILGKELFEGVPSAFNILSRH